MFGYVRYDTPNLFIKDLMLYRALYCGLCKGIKEACGQTARVGLTYDVAFLSALLHNLSGEDIEVVHEHCFQHPIRKIPVAKPDALTKELGALNTILAYFKLTDDVQDGNGGRGKRLWFKKGFRRAEKQYPALVALVRNYMEEQAQTEKGEASPDMAADPSARMMCALSVHFLGDKATEAVQSLFYWLGKWVYLIDALDDYDEDRKKHGFNPFWNEYKCESKEALTREKREELAFLFDTLFFSMREALGQVKFSFNRDLTDNVILRGIPLETERVLRGEKQKRFEGVRNL